MGYAKWGIIHGFVGKGKGDEIPHLIYATLGKLTKMQTNIYTKKVRTPQKCVLCVPKIITTRMEYKSKCVSGGVWRLQTKYHTSLVNLLEQ